MREDIEVCAQRVMDYLINNPRDDGFHEIMKLKLGLELSASKLFLALGWLLREGKIELGSSEYGYKVRCMVREAVEVPRLAEETSG